MRIILLLFFIIGSLFQQQITAQTIQGTVQDGATNNPLAYVNIGWVSQQLGTVSGDQGEFSLSAKNMPDSALLRFSMIGYTAQEFYWKDIKDQTTLAVNLVPNVTSIEEITVVDCTTESRKRKGNTLKNRPAGWMGFVSKELGTEIATKIRLKKNRENHLKALHCWIGNHDHDSLFFRLNIYKVKDGKPGETLL